VRYGTPISITPAQTQGGDPALILRDRSREAILGQLGEPDLTLPATGTDG
jgi:hypothetical protein